MAVNNFLSYKGVKQEFLNMYHEPSKIKKFAYFSRESNRI